MPMPLLLTVDPGRQNAGVSAGHQAGVRAESKAPASQSLKQGAVLRASETRTTPDAVEIDNEP